MIDWWAIGVLLYEMLVGIPPFYNRNQNKMYDQIINGSIRYPDPEKHGIEVDPQAQDLLNKLLDKNPSTRLGAKSGAKEILAHPFFSDVEVEKILNRELTPEYIPES